MRYHKINNGLKNEFPVLGCVLLSNEVFYPPNGGCKVPVVVCNASRLLVRGVGAKKCVGIRRCVTIEPTPVVAWVSADFDEGGIVAADLNRCDRREGEVHRPYSPSGISRRLLEAAHLRGRYPFRWLCL